MSYLLVHQHTFTEDDTFPTSLHPTLCHVDRSLPSFQLDKLETRFQNVLFAICFQEDIDTAIGLWVLLGIEWQELLLRGLLWV
ncbi:hypothetical protein GALMADRAFT_249299 [Galerina marginata CBS 339.88]|uniref:Uncharacterized protein n=1 Tax=Galerina marginata (strain CBS 339.88) TaxID=685588 RepID=A0A067T8G2_GALM3|nr:hypothetical protein GALMADRAFT_249299 [Galerina marginata CBS 339.88]